MSTSKANGLVSKWKDLDKKLIQIAKKRGVAVWGETLEQVGASKALEEKAIDQNLHKSMKEEAKPKIDLCDYSTPEVSKSSTKNCMQGLSRDQNILSNRM